MKKIALLILPLLLSNYLLAKIDTFKIISSNARRLGDDPEEFQWHKRKDLLINTILAKNPDIIGFQEVVKGEQLDDLKNGLSFYKSFGDARNDHATFLSAQWLISKHPKAKNESSPIFYNPKKVTLVDSGTFAINSSIFSGQFLPRICSWGLFEDNTSQKQFYVYNTHLDNKSNKARKQQLDIILKEAKKKNENTPVIIMGDMNTKIENDIENKLEKSFFIDARKKALTVKGPKETRTGWYDNELKEIDHILVKNADVTEFETVKSPEGIYPSDHRPIMAKIVLP